MKQHRSLFAFAAFFCCIPVAYGQANPGHPSFSAYDRHEIDTINLQSLTIGYRLPIRQKSGAMPFDYEYSDTNYMGQNLGAWVTSEVVPGPQAGPSK